MSFSSSFLQSKLLSSFSCIIDAERTDPRWHLWMQSTSFFSDSLSCPNSIIASLRDAALTHFWISPFRSGGGGGLISPFFGIWLELFQIPVAFRSVFGLSLIIGGRRGEFFMFSRMGIWKYHSFSLIYSYITHALCAKFCLLDFVTGIWIYIKLS